MFTASDEAMEIIRIFRESFADIKGTPKLLYGLGINTRAIINAVKDYNIIGVMDAKHEGEYFEGLRVYSEQEARKASAIIIIVARDAVIPIIFNRIRYLADAGIRICNIRGQNMQVNQDNSKELRVISESVIRNAISTHDIVCFDIFDTLLVRKVVEPNDIFIIVEARLKQKGIDLPFYELRKKAAALAAKKNKTPSLSDIYQEMAAFSSTAAYNCPLLIEEEIRTELDFIVPRKKVVDLLEYAKSQGKKVFLISEMYLSSDILQKILCQCGIGSYDKIFVSCEQGNNKWPDGDLFKLIKEKYTEGEAILHIGDNEGADILCAQKQGFDALRVPGLYELLTYSPFSFLLSHNRTIADSIAIGMFIVNYLDDFYETRKLQKSEKFVLKEEREVGYIAYGPLIVGFLGWLYNQCKIEKIDYIAFIARDGWILSRVWELMTGKLGNKSGLKGKYLLGSRRAVAIPALRSKEDIIEALQKVPKDMDNKHMMESRFGISNVEQEDMADREKCVAVWEDVILKNAEKERKRYKAYLDAELGKTKKVALVDAVSSGTIAKYFKRATGINSCLMCFVESCVPDYSVCDEVETYSYFGKDSKYAPMYEIHKHVANLESVLTAPDPMFVRFGDVGEEYSTEEPSQENKDILAKVHAGILQYANEFYNLIPDISHAKLTTNLCDTFFGFLYSCNACLWEESLKELGVRNPF